MSLRTRILCTLVPMVLAAACGGSEGVPDPRHPYGAVSRTVVATATGTMPLMDPATVYTTGVVGTKEIGGRTFDGYKFGHGLAAGVPLDETTPGTVVYVSGIGSDTLTLGGFAGEMGLAAEADTPVKIDLHPPVGEPQTVTATGTITSASDPVGKPGTITATYTLVEDDVTVRTTALGDVTGCRHFEGSFTVSGEALPAFLGNVSGTGALWYHPSLGILDARSPELGINMAQEGQNGWTEPEGGATVGRMVTVLDGTRTTVDFSTYDRAQAYDADMCQHAKMLVEVRWANDEDARTRGEPDPYLFAAEFNGGMGTFCWGGCALTASPVSIFHPEDNGKGYTFWYAFVSQALKNEVQPGGDHGSAYSIHVTKDASLPPLRITARIAYGLVDPASDCSM